MLMFCNNYTSVFATVFSSFVAQWGKIFISYEKVEKKKFAAKIMMFIINNYIIYSVIVKQSSTMWLGQSVCLNK